MLGTERELRALCLLLLLRAKLIFESRLTNWGFWPTVAMLLCARDFSCDFTKEGKRSLRPRFIPMPTSCLTPERMWLAPSVTFLGLDQGGFCQPLPMLLFRTDSFHPHPYSPPLCSVTDSLALCHSLSSHRDREIPGKELRVPSIHLSIRQCPVK